MSECRSRCFPGRGGLSAKTIADAARSFELDVRAFSTNIEAIRTLRLPAIVHWGFNHFVVLESLGERAAVIVDPGQGRRRISIDEFGERFTGVLLTFSPNPNFSRVAPPKRTQWIRLLWEMLADRSTTRSLIEVFGTSVLLQLTGLLLPLLTKEIVDVLIPFNALDVFQLVAAGMVVAVLARMVIGYLRSFVLLNLRSRLDDALMHRFMRHLLGLKFSFFQHRNTGDLLMRLGSNSVLRDLLTNQSVSTVLDGSMALMYLVVLVVMSPVLAELTLIVGAVHVLTILATRGVTADFAQRELAAKSEEQSYLTEAISSILVVKSSGSEAAVFDRWSRLFRTQLNIGIQRNVFNAHLDAVAGSVRMAAPLLVLWVGAKSVIAGDMTIGTMLAANAISGSFLLPLGSLIATAQQLQVVPAYGDRLTDVLDEPTERADVVGDGNAPQLLGNIEVANLSFRYDHDGDFVLKDVSFSVRAGEKLAVVGRTGSGKSTLAQVLVGIHNAEAGTIAYDGTFLEELSLSSVRRQVAIVLQQTSLFSGSILRNLTLGRASVSLEDVFAASKAAEIHEDILAMPLGYETDISEGGSALSGGQRQRLAIARALLQRPSTLILDEATSHLDSITELKVHENLGALACTRIVISHRPSTVADADRILVMEGGFVVEDGKHQELLELGGMYARLVQGQDGHAQEKPPAV